MAEGIHALLRRTTAGLAITAAYLAGRDSQWHNAASRRAFRRLYEADMRRVGATPFAETPLELAAIHQQDTDRAAR